MYNQIVDRQYRLAAKEMDRKYFFDGLDGLRGYAFEQKSLSTAINKSDMALIIA